MAAQTEIKYGVVSGGSTMKFFRDSKMGTYMVSNDFALYRASVEVFESPFSNDSPGKTP